MDRILEAHYRKRPGEFPRASVFYASDDHFEPPRPGLVVWRALFASSRRTVVGSRARRSGGELAEAKNRVAIFANSCLVRVLARLILGRWI